MPLHINKVIYVKVTAVCDNCNKKESHIVPQTIEDKAPNEWKITTASYNPYTKLLLCPTCAVSAVRVNKATPKGLLAIHEENIATNNTRDLQNSRIEILRRLDFYEQYMTDRKIDLTEIIGDQKLHKVGEYWPPTTSYNNKKDK